MKLDMDKDELVKRIEWFEKKYGPYIEKRGLNNWKNLFRKPTISEWTILFMLLMAIFMAFAYQEDTKLCRQTLENLDNICLTHTDSKILINNSGDGSLGFPDIDFSQLIITADNQSLNEG